MSLLSAFRAWRQRKLEYARLRASLETGWTRWSVTLALIIGVVLAITASQQTALIAACAFFFLMSLHFLFVLLRKLNFGLLELLAGASLAGAVNGLLLSMPGMLGSIGAAGLLISAVFAWVLYGLVKGLMCACIMGVVRAEQRLCWIAWAWLTSLSPAFLIASGLLFAFSDRKHFITPEFQFWSMPFLLLGVAGIVLKFALESKVSGKALEVAAGESCGIQATQ